MKAYLLVLSVLVASATAQLQPGQAGHGNRNHTSRVSKQVHGGVRREGGTAGELVVDNGVIRIGVVNGGQLNAFPNDGTSADASHMRFQNPIGVRYHINTPLENDATSPGCICEGFGAGATWSDGTYQEGNGNEGDLYPPTTIADDTGQTGDTYVAPVLIGANGVHAFSYIGGGNYQLNVTHDFTPAAETPNLYQVLVTLTNAGSLPISTLQYVRSMDWDIYPTTFHECVDIDLGTSTDVVCAHDDGFISSLPSQFTVSPIFGNDQLGAQCYGAASAGSSFFLSGPIDMGAAFLLQFQDITAATPLAPGASKVFKMYYGAADNRVAARAVLAAVSAEAYSFGYPSSNVTTGYDEDLYDTTVTSCDPSGTPQTYIWAFANVGGTPIIPKDTGCPNCNPVNIDPSCTSATVSSTGTCVTANFQAGAGCP